MATNLQTQSPSMLNQRQLSERIGISTLTLEKWRMIGKGPVFVKIGKSRNAVVRYRVKDVEEWEAGLPVAKTMDEEVNAALARHTR